MPTEPLLATDQPPDLGPGPRAGVLPEPELETELANFFRRHKVPPPKRALLKALILLWHDHLEAAHTIAQSVDTPDGAFLHGIMHRREPDYTNAAYWFRRVGRHAAFPEVARRAAALLDQPAGRALARELMPQGEWNPFSFITVCERVAVRPALDTERQLARELQRVETQVLFDYFTGEGGLEH